MITEFWNAKLNPITMYSKCVLVKEENRSRNRNIKENYLKAGNLTGYIPANELIKELGIGALKLKRLFASISEEPKYNGGLTYYPERHVKTIKEILNEPKQIPVIDKTGFISTQELIKMFGYKDNKAFKIIDKNKMVKAEFGGRINYYEKDMAISIFMKYKKDCKVLA